jgi:hypothetical protein
MHQSTIFLRYVNELKPLIAEIEALFEELPTVVLNELRAVFDHLSRCEIRPEDEKYISEQNNKASSHLDRCILDCFKILVVGYSDAVKKFENSTQNIDLSLVDNGDFLRRLSVMKSDARKLAQKARSEESLIEMPKRFAEWESAYTSYKNMSDFIDEKTAPVDWVRKKTIRNWIINAILWVGAVIGSWFIGHFLDLSSIF